MNTEPGIADKQPALHPFEENFSLVLGGPLFQLMRKAHLSDDALMLVSQRIVVIALLAWLPLLVLAALGGQLLPGSINVPFLFDAEVHIRFLVAMPLLILAELVVHRRMRGVVAMFLERNLIPDTEREAFDNAILSAFRLRNAVWAEILLIAVVYLFGILVVWRHYLTLDTATWYAQPAAGGSSLTLAGVWYGYVSLPFFQFLLCRWYFRLFIWARFLWQVSRLPLALCPAHPDRAGGLGFLANTVFAMVLLAVAHGAILAGPLANRIFFMGAALTAYKAEIAVMVVFMVCLIIGPLLVFAPQLAQVKREGLRKYGTLAERYVREFDVKWLHGTTAPEEPLVGSADIQSLADLGNSYEVVRTMRVVPFTRDTVVQLALATLLPVMPLALTMMPLEELLKTLFGVLF